MFYHRKKKIAAVLLAAAAAVVTLPACKGHDLIFCEAKEATCTESGNVAYWRCTDCGETFADDKGRVPLEETETAALGHDFGLYSALAATCTEDGEKVYACLRCGLTETEILSATGHVFYDYMTTAAATCTEDGEEKRVCSLCSLTETRAIPATGHVFYDYVTMKEATCTENGEEKRVCSLCSLTETRAIPATGHTFGTDNVCTACAFQVSVDGFTFSAADIDGVLGYAVAGGETTKGEKEIAIPPYYEGEPVVQIANEAFLNYTRLEVVTLYADIARIGQSAFRGCTHLQSFTVPDGVTKIGAYAFYSCTRLESLTIGAQVSEIGQSAFYRCSSLKEISVVDGNAVYRAEGNCLIRGTRLILGSAAAEIPGYITEIGDNAFLEMETLTKIRLPSCVEEIGDGAFLGCIALKEIDYDGLKTQWEAIAKGTDWRKNTNAFTVVCLDGDIVYPSTFA